MNHTADEIDDKHNKIVNRIIRITQSLRAIYSSHSSITKMQKDNMVYVSYNRTEILSNILRSIGRNHMEKYKCYNEPRNTTISTYSYTPIDS